MVATSFKDATSQITSVENLTDVETCKGFTADGTLVLVVAERIMDTQTARR